MRLRNEIRNGLRSPSLEAIKQMLHRFRMIKKIHTRIHIFGRRSSFLATGNEFWNADAHFQNSAQKGSKNAKVIEKVSVSY